MELHEVCHACRRLAGQLEVVLAHPVIAPLLVEFGHHPEVVDDMLRQARRPKFFAPLGNWRVAGCRSRKSPMKPALATVSGCAEASCAPLDKRLRPYATPPIHLPRYRRALGAGFLVRSSRRAW